MRQIKFRIWRGDYFELIGFTNKDDPYYFYLDNPEINPDCINQFTGLKDKNGQEIYEGDIISVDQKDFDVFNDEAKYRVKWMGEDGYPAFDLFGWEGECNGLAEVFQSGEYEIKVLGNIYENPGLIK